MLEFGAASLEKFSRVSHYLHIPNMCVCDRLSVFIRELFLFLSIGMVGFTVGAMRSYESRMNPNQFKLVSGRVWARIRSFIHYNELLSEGFQMFKPETRF